MLGFFWVWNYFRAHPPATEKAAAIETHAPDPLPANIDSGQVRQALLNLLMNAIDACPAGGVVLLRGIRGNGEVRVEVENTNGPIPRESVDRIFEPFFTTKPAGAGLGLAIARNVARGHGGELSLSRNQRDSAQFSITLPAGTGESERP